MWSNSWGDDIYLLACMNMFTWWWQCLISPIHHDIIKTSNIWTIKHDIIVKNKQRFNYRCSTSLKTLTTQQQYFFFKRLLYLPYVTSRWLIKNLFLLPTMIFRNHLWGKQRYTHALALIHTHSHSYTHFLVYRWCCWWHTVIVQFKKLFNLPYITSGMNQVICQLSYFNFFW